MVKKRQTNKLKIINQMSNTRANILMLIASLIWGTAFVSQATGMGAIGPFTFSFARFFFAFHLV